MFARLSSALVPLAVFAAMLLCCQTALCFTDHSASCEPAATNAPCGEKFPVNGEEPCPADALSCCHAHAPLAAQDRDRGLIAARAFSSEAYERQDFACVEGPVRAVDYPPQVS